MKNILAAIWNNEAYFALAIITLIAIVVKLGETFYA